MILFRCYCCSYLFLMSDDFAGKRVRCLMTGQQVQMPNRPFPELHWFESREPLVKMHVAARLVSVRKLWLIAFGCLRRVQYLWDDKDQQRFSDMEQRLDELVQQSVRPASARDSFRVQISYTSNGEGPGPGGLEWPGGWSTTPKWLAAWYLARMPEQTDPTFACLAGIRAVQDVARRGHSLELGQANQDLCALIGDVCGNPFHPIVFDPSWRAMNEGAVVRMAHSIDENRSYADLPILGDALVDAGCTQEWLLRHCRARRTHGPGCWVIDSLLGKD